MSKELQNLEYCNRALKLKNVVEADFLVLGEYLHNIKEKCLYEPQWASYYDFLQEMHMSENMARKLVQIYKTFILGYGFSVQTVAQAGGWSTLQEILPVVKTKKDALHWLASASELTTTDLKRSVKEAQTGIDMTHCKHESTYQINVCRDCGDRWSHI